MKKNATLFLFAILLAGNINCQTDSITSRKVKFIIHHGLSITNQSRINDAYGTNSFYDYGLGLRIGTPETNKIIPFFIYDRVKYSSFVKKEEFEIDSDTNTNIKINQFTLGVLLPMYCNNNNNISIYCGSNLGKQAENSLKLDKFYFGFKMGINYEAKISKNFSYSLGVEYDLNNAFPNNRYIEITNQYGDKEYITSNLQNINWIRIKMGIIF